MSQSGDGRPRVVGREAAIEQYRPLIKYVVGKLAPRPNAAFDYEDLCSYGFIGLMDAWDRFDAGRGVKFETYAITRIRGAVIDAIRSQDPLSRGARLKARRIDQMLCSLTTRFGRLPRRLEMAEALDCSPAEYDAMVREAGWATVSLDVFELDGDAAYRAPTPPDSSVPDFSDRLVRAETHNALSRVVAALPEREQLIVSLYYVERLTMKEIAIVLDVSTTRVCQLHSRALSRLRVRLRAEDAA